MFLNNSAVNGGAIAIEDTSYIYNSTDTDYVGNRASKYGGAIYMINVTKYYNASSCQFSKNTAGLNGGAIYMNGEGSAGSPVYYYSPNCLFDNNSAI